MADVAMKDQPAAPVTEKPTESTNMENTGLKEEDITGDKGVLKKIIKEGSGWERPKDGAEVKVHYVGTLLDGTKFDSSRDRDSPFEFKLGAKQVIKGWEEAVQTMKKGEIAEFTLAASYAYGAAGSPPKIPPNATLRFEIELLEWTLDKDISKAKDGSVLKRVLREGDGWERPKRETAVQVHVVARLAEAGPAVQDARLDCSLGDGSLPAGVERLLKDMKKGEKCAAVVQPQHAYGAAGSPALGIPPNATVYYELELLTMQKEKEPWEMTNEDKFAQAAARREHGNTLFKQGNLKRAAKRYKSALSCLTSDHAFSDEQKKQARAAQVPCHLNIAACHLKRQQWKAAAESCKKALELEPGNAKALFRHAQACVELGELLDAQRDVARALETQPKDAELLALQKRVTHLQAQQDKRDKAVFAKMFAN